MVTMSAANTTALKSFDPQAFISGFRQPEFRVPMYRRADLLQQIDDMDVRLDDLEVKVDLESKSTVNRSMSDKSSLAELNRLTTERNALAEEFEASKVDFLFRPMTHGEAKIWSSRTKQLTEEDETDLPIFAEGIALTCTSHPMSVDDWLGFCDQVGAFAFRAFGRAWNLAIAGDGKPDAPFSPRSLPTPTKETSSSD